MICPGGVFARIPIAKALHARYNFNKYDAAMIGKTQRLSGGKMI